MRDLYRRASKRLSCEPTRRSLLHPSIGIVGRHPYRHWAISIARPDVILLFVHQFHSDRTPAAILIGARVIAQRIQVVQIVADRSERLFLFVPVFSEVGLASRRRGHSLKNRSRYRF